ncbi:MAG: phospholipase D-like domain-containing protein [Thaumarchaeota archaeon]|nr:phospholipase D-like domain-containing protein [Nitrososphaerota archaeon]
MSQRPTDWAIRSVFFDAEVLEQINLLVSNARDRVTLVTPYLNIWEHLKSKIDEAVRRKVQISFLIRRDDDDRVPRKRRAEDAAWLISQGVRVILVPNLHAKIYMSEKTVILSSMNITEPSIANSREFAVLLRRDEDAEKVREYVANLVTKFGPPDLTHTIGKRAADGLSNLVKKLEVMEVERSEKPRLGKAGNCIRCGTTVVYHPERPMCDECYAIWAKYKNKDYAEEYCHSCGKKKPTSFRRPLCLACYNKTG